VSYNPATDFLALQRQTGNGMRTARMPGLDYVIAALARAGQFTLHVGQTEPTTDQEATVWLRPASQSWLAEGTVFLWNLSTAAYELATPELWHELIHSLVGHTQDVTTAADNILFDASVVRVMNVGAEVDLVLPEAVTKVGDVLVSDWANLAGTFNIRIHCSGADTFPNGATIWTIAQDSGSVCFRPVPGGYVL
jgi:hypothetical protein